MKQKKKGEASTEKVFDWKIQKLKTNQKCLIIILKKDGRKKGK